MVMNTREIVVRIIQPAEQPQPPKIKANPVVPEKKEKNLFQAVINGIALAAIAALGVYLMVSFFNLGFSFRDILILVGIPLTVGIVTSYAIF